MSRKFFIIMLVTGILFSVSAAAKFKKGDLVLANNNEGAWAYPARITAIDGETVTVKYEDGGESEELAIEFIQPYNWAVGSQVQCNWKKEGTYYAGKITSMKGTNIHVVYDDGDEEDTSTTICRVQNRAIPKKAASSGVMLTLKNACSGSVEIREEQASGSTYQTSVSSGANIYRSFGIGDRLTILSSGASVEIEDAGWNAVEIDSGCRSWCVIDRYNSKNCN